MLEREAWGTSERARESESGRFSQVTPSSRSILCMRGKRTDHHPGSVKLDHSEKEEVERKKT